MNASCNNSAVIIDDDQQYLTMLSSICNDIGFEAHTYDNAEDFLNQDCLDSPLILLDLSLPNIDGIEVLRTLSSRHITAKIILLSGQDKSVLKAAENLAKAQKLLHVATFSKPLKVAELRKVLAQQIDDKPLGLQQNQQLNQQQKQQSNHYKIWQPSAEELELAIYNLSLIHI